MHFFLVLTNDCNLQCRYCIGSEPGDAEGLEVDDDVPSEIAYDLKDLKRFLAKDPDPTVILYGGEPLLRAGLVREVMDTIPARYMLQTNGLLLKNLDAGHVLQLENIMLSIDGCEATTDANRGKGVYKAVLKAAKLARESGFRKEIIARMTVAPGAEVYREVAHLLSIPYFDSVHWQLDACFHKENIKGFADWADKSYNPGVTKLVRLWLDRMRKGKVLRIYPFVGVMSSMLAGESSKLRCGAGWAQYAILTDGKIAPCPVMGGLKEFYAGDIWDSSPSGLREITPGPPCSGCSILHECGGRCLYANRTMLWGKSGFDCVCSTAKHLVSELQKAKPEVEKMIGSGVINPSDFDYPKFNSCEIIP